ncbi:hypothetical protein C8R43DRAFT_438354 [Mycena crocata]|nr:hypothetical protein C8R43DRAFT_438354 [Mycena crocata]
MDPVLAEIIHGNRPPTDSQYRHIQCMLDAALPKLQGLDESILKASRVLSDLEHQKSHLRNCVTSLKAALSPIRRLPSEILVEIFMFCRSHSLQSETYSIADPREAPMLLGQISSHWRSVCHGTPLLWDQLHLKSGPHMPEIPGVQRILARSCRVPVSVDLALLDQSITVTVESALGLLLNVHDRLEHVKLHFRSKNLVPPRTTYQIQTFAILASVDILLTDPDGDSDASDSDDSNDEPDITSIVNLFSKAPCLRAVSLTSECIPTHSIVFAFPWEQLTQVQLTMPISLKDIGAILNRCHSVQTASFWNPCSDLDEMERQQCICRLPHLRSFDLGTDDYTSLDSFLQAFSFPNLRDLFLQALEPSPLDLSNLYVRSVFNLDSLVLAHHDVNGPDLVDFLQLLPTLREVHLCFCGVDDYLLEAFTFEPGSPPLLKLPHLEQLVLAAYTYEIQGISAVCLSESVSAYSGSLNSSFPVLKLVTLELEGEEFDSDIQDRLLEATAMGLFAFEYTD